MLAWKKDWFATVINPDDYQTEVPFENASGSTQQRRKRKFVNENTSALLQGSAALDYEDQDYTEAAQVLRELHKNPELGPQLLNLVKKIKAGKDDESIIPTLKIAAIKYACNVLGKIVLLVFSHSLDEYKLVSIKSNKVTFRVPNIKSHFCITNEICRLRFSEASFILLHTVSRYCFL